MSADLGNLFKQACLDELQAIKPGNVHVFADGHGMTVQDFMRSAEAASAFIDQPFDGLGARIFASVCATHQAVGCNTNLGIILLCAPIIHAVQTPEQFPLRQKITKVLSSTTVQDAQAVFDAIQLANPAGLGEVGMNDVRQPAACTLVSAMRQAAQHDLIAQQYANEFADIFESGIPCYQHAWLRWQNESWAATYVYLNFLVSHLDSHIVRKYGKSLAKEVQSEAKQHLTIFAEIENPKTYLGELLRWDSSLKGRKINPGTCADLTVATLFVAKLKEMNGHT